MKVPDCCVKFCQWLPYTSVAAGASAVTSFVYSTFLNMACSVKNADSNDSTVSRVVGSVTNLLGKATETSSSTCETGEGTVCCYGRHSYNASLVLLTLTAVSCVSYVAARVLLPSSTAAPNATSPTHNRSYSAPAATSPTADNEHDA